MAGKCLFALVLVLAVASASAQSALPVAQVWTGSWAASQQLPEPQNSLAPDDLCDATLRQIVHLSAGGSAIRLHLSNAFGTQTLHLASVHVARPVSAASAKIDPASDRAVTFSGRPDVIIPAGADYLSDPVAFPVPPLSDLAVNTIAKSMSGGDAKTALKVLQSMGVLERAKPGSTDPAEIKRLQDLEARRAKTAAKKAEGEVYLAELTTI